MTLRPGETKQEHDHRLDETLLRMQGRTLAWKWAEEDPSRVKARLEARAAEARLCIAVTKRHIESGELELRNGGYEFEYQLNDYAAIAAAKMAQKDLTIAQWNEDMVREFGEGIRSHLTSIRKCADSLIQRDLLIQDELEMAHGSSASELTERSSPQLNRPEASAVRPNDLLSQVAAVPRSRGLNMAQRIVLFVGALMIAGLCLFPPWNEESVILGQPQSRVTRPAGYHSLIVPPRLPRVVDDYASSLRVDSTRLVIQCFVIVVLTGGLMVLLRRRNA